EHPRLEELHAELPFGIHPHARHAQIRLRRELGEALERVLVAAFGPDVLAAFDRDFLIADVHTLILLADDVHLYAAIVIYHRVRGSLVVRRRTVNCRSGTTHERATRKSASSASSAKLSSVYLWLHSVRMCSPRLIVTSSSPMCTR